MNSSPLTASPAFTEILRQNRARYNTLFNAARLNSPSLDGALFGAHISACVAPIVQQVYEVQSERASEVASVLYELSLDLFSKNLLGAAPRSEFIPLAWNQLFPLLSQLLAREPKRLAGAICNALLKMESEPGLRVQSWMEGMGVVAPLCNGGEEFLQAGEVAAWRCGMAHKRGNALNVAGKLAQVNDAVARAVLGAGQGEISAADAIKNYQRSPWWTPATPDNTRRVRRVAGAFHGFAADHSKSGAVFSAPPRVTLHEGRFFAADEENCWLFFADAFGASFHRMGALLEFTSDPYSPSFGGPLFGADEIPELQSPSSIATDGTTWAVTLPYSYGIYLVG